MTATITPASATFAGAAQPASLTPALLTRLAGRVTAAPDAPHVTTRAPYTGAELAHLPISRPEDVEDAFTRARVAQRAWAAMPVQARKKILLRFHDLVLARQDEALDLMQAENGKTRRDAFLEVSDIAITARYYARLAPRALRPHHRMTAIPGLVTAREHHVPKGVVGVISPWNYPLVLAVSDALAALVAGNGIVIKPDSQTPFTALRAFELLLLLGAARQLRLELLERPRELLVESTDLLLGDRPALLLGMQLVERLAHVASLLPQLSQLGPEALAVFGNYLEYVQVEAGRQVIGQDEQGDFLLIVLDGTVAVERVQPWGAKARLGESRAGDVLGEMSLLDAGARFSACTTLTPAKFAVLGAAALDRMMQHEPRMAAALLAWLARRLSLRLRQVSARLSALLTRE